MLAPELSMAALQYFYRMYQTNCGHLCWMKPLHVIWRNESSAATSNMLDNISSNYSIGPLHFRQCPHWRDHFPCFVWYRLIVCDLCMHLSVSLWHLNAEIGQSFACCFVRRGFSCGRSFSMHATLAWTPSSSAFLSCIAQWTLEKYCTDLQSVSRSHPQWFALAWACQFCGSAGSTASSANSIQHFSKSAMNLAESSFMFFLHWLHWTVAREEFDRIMNVQIWSCCASATAICLWRSCLHMFAR